MSSLQFINCLVNVRLSYKTKWLRVLVCFETHLLIKFLELLNLKNGHLSRSKYSVK